MIYLQVYKQQQSANSAVYIHDIYLLSMLAAPASTYVLYTRMVSEDVSTAAAAQQVKFHAKRAKRSTFELVWCRFV